MKRLLIFLLLFPLFGNAQLITWDKTYNLNQQDYGYDIVQNFDGGYTLTGYTGGNHWTNLLVMKLTCNGDTIWTRVHADEGHSAGSSIVNTSDSGYIVTGFTSDSEMYTFYEMYILKLNHNGDTIWTKKYGGGNTIAFSVIQTLDGGYTILGSDYAFDLARVIILKLNENGEEEWGKTYIFNTSGYPHFVSSIEQNHDSSFILAGTKPQLNGLFDIWLMKLDKLGDSLWTKLYGEPDVCEYGTYALPVDAGGYIVSVQRDIPNSIKKDLVIMKLDDNGTFLWEKTYERNAIQGISFLKKTTDNDYVGAGYCNYINGGGGLYIVRFNNFGDTLWTRIYHQNAHSSARDIIQTDDLGFIVSGGSSNASGFYRDIRVLKLDESGLVQTKEAKEVTNNTYIRNFPNPFRDYTFLEFEIGNYDRDAKITIYNSNGLVIKEIPLTDIHKGKNTIRVDAFDLPAGIYYCTLKTSSAKVSSKMIKIQ